MINKINLRNKLKLDFDKRNSYSSIKNLQALLFLILSVTWGYSHSEQTISPLKADFKLDGLSTVDLSAEWWKWAMANQGENNPVQDTTGSYCNVGQQGKVWFLAGGFGSAKIKRSCAIPSGKYVFFPIINMAYWPPVQNTNLTCNKAIINAALNNDTALDLFVQLDGVQVNNPKAFRAKTIKCFDINERAPKAFVSYYNAYPSASDGYWIFLKPLEKGKHSFKFGGRYNNNDSDNFGKMYQDIEYDITVQ